MNNITKADYKRAESYIEISEEDLPLACPSKLVSLWNMHPRVYLTLDATNKVACPYCGTFYKLSKSIKK